MKHTIELDYIIFFTFTQSKGVVRRVGLLRILAMYEAKTAKNQRPLDGFSGHLRILAIHETKTAKNAQLCPMHSWYP